MTFKQLCDWAPLSSFFTKDTLSGQQYYYYYYYYYYQTEHDCRLAAGVVNCCKQSVTLGTCCSPSLSIVLTTPKSNRRWAWVKFLF